MISIQVSEYCLQNEEALLQRIQFALSPLHELLRSLHVLANPKHHGIHLSWVVETVERLTPEMRFNLDYFSLFYELGIPSSLLPSLGQFQPSFEQEIERLPSLDIALLQEQLQDISVNRESDFIPSLARGIEWKDFHFCRRGELLDDIRLQPTVVIRRFIDFVQDYWKQVFSTVWNMISKTLLADIASQSRYLYNLGFASFIKTISERITWEKEVGIVHIRKPFHWRYTLKNTDAILCLPSYFTWPHLFVDKMTDGIMITYDASLARREATTPQSIERVATLCKALGEQSRLQILSFLQEREMTTQGLAQLCHLSEGTVSRHLQLLKQAGLLVTRAEGKYVIYRCPIDLFEHLSQIVASLVDATQDSVSDERSVSDHAIL